MNITKLHMSLKEAYSVNNLNGISLTLIQLYRNKQFSVLHKIGEMLSDWVKIEISETGKGFSQFMFLYHPDRSSFHRNEIDQLAKKSDYNGLLNYMHILRLERIEEIANSLNSFEDVDYSPVYEWDFKAHGFRVVVDFDIKEQPLTVETTRNFYDAIKLRVFEDLEMEFPFYYLEDLDELELSASGISDLEGVECCKHVTNLDLSDNTISDISPLFGLSALEDLNLSDNKIESIEVLSNLVNLKSLILASNNITDITPLFELGKLDYVDLTGNRIIEKQVEELVRLSVNVDF